VSAIGSVGGGGAADRIAALAHEAPPPARGVSGSGRRKGRRRVAVDDARRLAVRPEDGVFSLAELQPQLLQLRPQNLDGGGSLVFAADPNAHQQLPGLRGAARRAVIGRRRGARCLRCGKEMSVTS